MNKFKSKKKVEIQSYLEGVAEYRFQRKSTIIKNKRATNGKGAIWKILL